MSGFQEILLVAVILVGILFVPRMMARKIEPGPRRPAVVLSRKTRLAVAASVVYPAIAAALLQPWRRGVMMFFYAGLGPIVLGWLAYWVFAGRKK